MKFFPRISTIVWSQMNGNSISFMDGKPTEEEWNKDFDSHVEKDTESVIGQIDEPSPFEKKPKREFPSRVSYFRPLWYNA